MSPVAPARLPEGFTLEPATGDHTAEVYDVVAAEMNDAFGLCPMTVDDVRADLTKPPPAVTHQLLVRDRDGTPVQWWASVLGAGDPTFFAWVRTHPGLAEPIRDEVAAGGFSTLLDWIREQAPAGQEVRVRSGCPAGSAAAHRHLEAAGFTHRRTFWEMVGPVSERTRNAVPVPGLELTPAAGDLRTAHRILDEAFAGNYGYQTRGYDDWLAFERSFAGFDPDLWVFATLDGVPAAVLQMTRRAQAEGLLYVAELATAEPHRRRGVGGVLLAHAFGVAAREGLERVSLHVDSESTDDAPSLYRRAGFEVRCAFHSFARTLQT